MFSLLLFPHLLVAQQKTTNSTSAQCSPIIQDNHGHIDIRCSGLTKEDKNVLAGIPDVLNDILAKQLSAAEAEALFKGIRNQLSDVQKDLKQLESRPEDPNRGLLVPANDPNPVVDYRCELKAGGSFRLYLGSVLFTSPGFPDTAIDIRGKNVLGFTQHNGNVGIVATVTSPDGAPVAFIKDGYFKLEDYFRKETPDSSTLNVYNETDDTPVLHIRYLNQRAILVTGKFTNQGVTLDINDKRVAIIRDGKVAQTFEGSCFTPAPSTPMTGLPLVNIY